MNNTSPTDVLFALRPIIQKHDEEIKEIKKDVEDMIDLKVELKALVIKSLHDNVDTMSLAITDNRVVLCAEMKRFVACTNNKIAILSLVMAIGFIGVLIRLLP